MSVGSVKSTPVPREVIQRLLDAAAQAPNHHKVRPWRFVVLTGAARERLGEALAQATRKNRPGTPPEAVAVEAAKPLRAPVLIVVGVDKPAGPKVLEIENVCAAAAATENLLLAAQALDLAAKWRTGWPATDPGVKAFLGFEPDQHLIGFIYLGYPAEAPVPPSRPDCLDRVTWLE